jgi:hypothetical protein
MSESSLKDLLYRGRRVEIDHDMKRYVVNMVTSSLQTEFAFGDAYGHRTTSDYFEGILYLRDYGYSLSELLHCVDSSRIHIY